jgi:O-antigen/teichoic acid export membrane protein
MRKRHSRHSYMEKSVMRTVAEGTAWVSITTLFLKIISLATVFVMLTRLDVGAYGALELALSITTLLSFFLLPGLDALVTADMGVEIGVGNRSRARALAKAFVSVQVLLSLIAFAVVYTSAFLFAQWYDLSVHYVQLASLLFLVSPFRSLYGIVFRTNLNFGTQSIYSLVEESAKLLFLLVFFFNGFAGVAGVLIAIIVSQWVPLIILLPWFLRVWNSYKGGDASTPVKWRSFLWGNNAWGIASTYMGSFGRSARLWVVGRMLGHEAVGLYAVAAGLMGHTVALAPINTIIAPILPRFSGEPARFARLFMKSLKYQLAAYVGIGVIAFFLFPPILGIIFPRYQEAFPLFQIMLIGLIPGAAIAVITPAFFALKLQKNLFISQTLKAIMSVLFTYGGALLFGLYGLALESILTSTVQTIERMRSLRKHVPEIGQPYAGLMRMDDDDRLILERIGSQMGRVASLVRRST